MLVSLPFVFFIYLNVQKSVDLCHFYLIYSCPSTSYFENKQKWNPFSVLSFALILNHFQLGAGAPSSPCTVMLCKNAVCFSLTLFWIYYFHVFIFNVFFFFLFLFYSICLFGFVFSLLLRFTFGMSDGVRKQQQNIHQLRWPYACTHHTQTAARQWIIIEIIVTALVDIRFADVRLHNEHRRYK